MSILRFDRAVDTLIPLVFVTSREPGRLIVDLPDGLLELRTP